jgi:hypothetical protein
MCIASSRAILLDVRRDRYLMVPDVVAGEVWDWLHAAAPEQAPAALIHLLEASGTLARGEALPPQPVATDIAIPHTLAGRAPSDLAGGGASVAARSALLVAATRLRLRALPLATTLNAIRGEHDRAATASTCEALRRLATYEQARRYVPFARNCLLDSVAQSRWLSRAGIGCSLVFGVTGQPFSAHCWLQSADTILNDTYEHVSRFTPILVL